MRYDSSSVLRVHHLDSFNYVSCETQRLFFFVDPIISNLFTDRLMKIKELYFCVLFWLRHCAYHNKLIVTKTRCVKHRVVLLKCKHFTRLFGVSCLLASFNQSCTSRDKILLTWWSWPIANASIVPENLAVEDHLINLFKEMPTVGKCRSITVHVLRSISRIGLKSISSNKLISTYGRGLSSLKNKACCISGYGAIYLAWGVLFIDVSNTVASLYWW